MRMYTWLGLRIEKYFLIWFLTVIMIGGGIMIRLGSSGLILAQPPSTPALDAKDYFERGIASYDFGDYQQAILDYDQAIALDPEYIEAYYNRGLVHYYLTHDEQAIEDFTQAVTLDPEYVNAYWGRGSAYYQLKDFPAAIADYRTYEKLTGNLERIMILRIEEMETVIEEQ